MLVRYGHRVRPILGAIALVAAAIVLPATTIAVAPAGASVPQAPGTIGAGNQFSCAVARDGDVRCWGQNNTGQLGDGTTLDSATPVDVIGLGGPAAAVETSDGGSGASGAFACALTTTGGVRCWGTNDQGQLGNGTTTTWSPVGAVAGLTSGVQALAAGGTHSCAITAAGGVRCWGSNGAGQLGNGTDTTSSTPVNVTGLTSGVRAVAAGTNHSCAISATHDVWCWGHNLRGQLGNGATSNSSTPVQVTSLAGDADAIAGSSGTTCAVTDGDVWCWGQNNLGQLGNGTTTASSTPVQVVGITGEVTALTAGTGHWCARTDDGTGWCWGQAADGKLGEGTVTDGLSARAVALPAADVAAISAGQGHTCALTVAGSVRCWGSNGHGELGNGLVEQVPTPTGVPAWATGATKVAAGSFHSCARTTTGAAVCWGDNFYGQLGVGSNQRHLTPTAVTGLDSGVLEIGVGGGFSCALTTTGAVSCWGNNSVGQLGNGTTTPATSPVPVSGLGSGVAHLAVGSGHSCATLTDGTVRCWGQGTSGQLGNGGTINARTPVVAQGLTDVAEVAPGGSHTCARTTAGAAWCWGANSSLQLLNGVFGGAPKVPTITPYTSGVTDITAGSAFTCMVLTGAVRCNGSNAEGQIGSGSTAATLQSTQVSGLTSGMASVDASWNHACAVTTAGATSCWGANADGQLGDGTFAAKSSVPVAVTGQQSGIASVSAGTNHTCTVDTSGGIACWGRNERGQLGSSSPTWLPSSVGGGGTYGPPLPAPPVAADQTVSAARNQDTPITLGASDPNGDPVTFAFTSPAKGDLDCTVGGSCTYRSAPEASGTDSFTFIASDDQGGSDSATVSITLVNTAPVADGQAVSIPRRIPTAITLTGADANDDALTYAVDAAPAKGALECTGASCTYTSSPGATGTDSFTFTVDDGFGGTDAGTVEIALANSVPTADPQALSTPARATTPIALTGSDPNGDALAFAVTTGPGKGALTCDGSGACSYRSDAGATGTDTFTFSVDDGEGGVDTAIVDISLSNTKPVADPQTVDAPRQVTTAITLTGSDPNDDPLTYTAPLTGPSKGSLSCDPDGACSYSSSPGATGTDTFTFTVTDAGGESDTATVTIALTNAAPEAQPSTVTVTQGTTKRFTLGASDPNGDAVTASVITPPGSGSLTCDDASCTYTASGPVGTDTVEFVATDPEGASSAPATVAITIAPPKVSLGDAQVFEPAAGQPTMGVYVPVTLTAPVDGDVTITYYTVDQSATGGAAAGDYRTWGTPSSPRTVTVAARSTWRAIAVPIAADTATEPDETFQVRIASVTAAGGRPVAIGDASATVTIVDTQSNDPLLIVQDHETYESDHPGHRGQFTIEMSKPLSAPITLNLIWTSETATMGRATTTGADWHPPTATTLTLPAGTPIAKTVDYSIWGDTTVEPDETFHLTVVPAPDAPLVQHKPTGTATLLDDDS